MFGRLLIRMSTPDKPFDVFISHSTQDAQAAAAIKQHLQASGLKCWKAPDDIYPGESWPAAITRALSMCRVMVLVWSSNSLASREVSKELTIAMRNGLTVIPFRIEDVQPTSEWDYHLANTHWMDAFPGDLAPFVQSLASRIQSVTSNPADTAIPPSGAPPRGTNTALAGSSSGSRLPSGMIVFGSLLIVGALGAWFFMQGGGGARQPAAPAIEASQAFAQEAENLRKEADQAKREKDEALRQASEKEAESLRQIAQRAEAERQLALQRAEQAEEAARLAQLEKTGKTQASDDSSAANALTGSVSDPDGYTNVRRGPGTKNADGSEMLIVGTIRVGEVFEYFPDYSNWWRVRTTDGVTGFVHKSRIVAAEPSTSPGGVWLFPDSSIRLLRESELQGLSQDQLWRARNEIFARRGYIFQSDRGKALARSLDSAYSPVSSVQNAVISAMNPVERANIERISSFEKGSSQ